MQHGKDFECAGNEIAKGSNDSIKFMQILIMASVRTLSLHDWSLV